MKLKLELDKKTIRDFLLQNVEKIVLGAVVFVFLLILYSSLTTAGRFDRTPEQLRTQAANGRRELDSTPAESSLAISDYVSQAKRSRVHIQEKPYGHLVLWDKPVFEKRPLRDAPPLFAVQQLRGTAEVGAFRKAVAATTEAQPEQPEARRSQPTGAAPALPPFLRGGGAAPALPSFLRGGAAAPRGVGGEEVRGQRWIVVTGLVPMEKQEAAFAEAFKPSVFYDARQDYPVYLGYWVERVEVAGADEAASPDWSKATTFMSNKAVAAALTEWSAAAGVEVVAPEYIEERLVFPLGPLLDRPWGASAAHVPEIPLIKINERGGGLGMRGMPMERLALGRPFNPLGEGRGRESAAEGTPFDNQETGATETGRRLPAETTGPDEEKKAPEYRLFRFFDFSVEPGKQYVYRVCLALQNPNRDVKPAFLEKPELAKDTFLKTKWSEPSPAISVPRDTHILLVSVKPPASRANSEPSGQILVIKWLQRKGAEVFKEFSMTRGQVANFPDVEVRIPSGGRQATDNVGGLPAFPGSGSRVKVNFLSGAIAVDFRGGERLPSRRGGTLTAAGEILLLDSDGVLVVRNELDDTPTYEQLTSRETEPATEETSFPGIRPGMMLPPGIGRIRPGLEMLDQGTPPPRGRPRP